MSKNQAKVNKILEKANLKALDGKYDEVYLLLLAVKRIDSCQKLEGLLNLVRKMRQQEKKKKFKVPRCNVGIKINNETKKKNPVDRHTEEASAKIGTIPNASPKTNPIHKKKYTPSKPDESEPFPYVSAHSRRNFRARTNSDTYRSNKREKSNNWDDLEQRNTFRMKGMSPKATVTNAKSTPEKPNEPEIASYTREEMELVQKVNSSKGNYKILGVKQDANIDEIKRAYKRLALKLHPDKNRAPGASEAFKRINNAVTVLSDRTFHRPCNTERSNVSSQTYGYRQQYTHTHNFTRFESSCGDNMDDEEQTNPSNFDYTQEDQFHSKYSSPYQREHNNDSGHNSQFFKNLISIFLITGLIAIGILLGSYKAQQYSLQRTWAYTEPRQTHRLHIPYFVDKNFNKKSANSIEQVERAIEQEFIILTKDRCNSERRERDTLIQMTRFRGTREQFAIAKEMRMPACDTLTKLGIYRNRF